MSESKSLIVVGDRVLVLPEEPKDRTSHGLYLPQGIHEKERVQGGVIVKTGPGYPLPEIDAGRDEPWMMSRQIEPKYLPMQAQEGDYAIFLRKAAIEIEFDGKTYLIVPQSAIMVLLRDEKPYHREE
ncbi:MAG: co-chaperone GroES [Bacteroidetes bacterium]|nr:co-chaperone GroES [Bacteroidota bacterium]